MRTVGHWTSLHASAIAFGDTTWLTVVVSDNNCQSVTQGIILFFLSGALSSNFCKTNVKLKMNVKDSNWKDETQGILQTYSSNPFTFKCSHIFLMGRIKAIGHFR